MKDRSYFLREDLPNYKRKFRLLCREKEFKIEKFSNIIANVNRKHYICITEIK